VLGSDGENQLELTIEKENITWSQGDDEYPKSNPITGLERP